MPPESGIFHFLIAPCLEGDAESEIARVYLRTIGLKERQQGVVGKEADVLTANAERGVQLELVDVCSIVTLDLRAVGKLHPIPLCNA